ncbi:MAG: glycine betaine ABC transporter substrate-binding protein, partial [Bacteroidota bacterium]|nr:glycine betaine ABC transporter substrate-binding protein [Bacteroidota bacterium]
MIKKGILFILTIITVSFYFSSCNIDYFNDKEERKLKIVYTDWSEGIALTHLSAILLEEKMGYEVTLKLTEVKKAYRDIANNKADIFADAWLPETHKHVYNLYSDKIEKIGITYPEAKIGLVVPAYSKFNTINDLVNYQKSIIGIDTNSGVVYKANLAIDKYKLNCTLINHTEKAMVKHLENSLKRRKDVVITGWEPHWIFARYDLKFLKDPKNVFGDKEKIYTIANKNINEKHPNAVRFFERMQLSEKQLNKLIHLMGQNDDP